MMMVILVVMMTVLVILAEMVMMTNTRQTQKPHCLKAVLPTSTPTLKTLFLFCKYELHNMNTRFLTRDGIVWWLGQKCTGEYNPKLQEGDQLVERIANQDNADGYDDDGENYEKGDYDDDDDDDQKMSFMMVLIIIGGGDGVVAQSDSPNVLKRYVGLEPD